MTTPVKIKNLGEDQVVVRWATKNEKGEIVPSTSAIVLDSGQEEMVYLHSGNMVVIEER